MSDTEAADDADHESTAEASPDTEDDSSRGPDIDVDAVVGYLMWGALVALGVLAAVATAGLYGSLSAIIDVWVASRYQPFARSALNFAVLCVAAAGIVAIARRLRRS
jgi:hypothetical protein